MSLEALVGRTYGPLRTTISPAKSAEYVAATGDDPDRWHRAAPPSYAGALLFAIAPSLIHDPDVGEHTRVLVHSDQLFRWSGPLTHNIEVAITGTVARVRERGGLNFVTFEATVNAGESTLVESVSTFLMGSTPAAEPAGDTGEPPVGTGSVHGRADPVGELAVGASIPTVRRAASRLDLVRYAAASGDFNPIHFDHESARSAGLDGIVVHGLLMSAWLTQLAQVTTASLAPLVEMKIRFRSALRPADTAEAGGDVSAMADGGATLALALRRDGADLVTAKVVTRT